VTAQLVDPVVDSDPVVVVAAATVLATPAARPGEFFVKDT
jgi:hypothetical protein